MSQLWVILSSNLSKVTTLKEANDLSRGLTGGSPETKVEVKSHQAKKEKTWPSSRKMHQRFPAGRSPEKPIKVSYKRKSANDPVISRDRFKWHNWSKTVLVFVSLYSNPGTTRYNLESKKKEENIKWEVFSLEQILPVGRTKF